MRTEDEREQDTVQSVFEHASDQMGDAVHKATRAASNAAEAIGDGIGAARRAAKHGSYAAAELYCDAKRRVQKNPTETVVASLAAGVAVGMAFSWLMRRINHCPVSERHLRKQ